MKKTVLLSLIFGFVILMSNPVQAGKKKKEKKTDWSTYNFLELIKGKVPGPVKKRYEGIKRVYIADLVINQQVFSKYSKTSYGGMSHGTSTARMKVNLGGVDYKAYQDAVAKLYNDLEKYYIEQGYEIVTEEEVRQTELFKETEPGKRIVVANASEVEPVRFGDGGLNKYVAVRPANKLLVYNDANKDKLTKGAAPWKVYFKLANELNALVVSYTYTATFVVMGGKGGYFNTKASVGATPAMSIYGGSMLTLAPSSKKTQPTSGGFYQEEGINGNNNGWISPDGFVELDENQNSLYWSGSSSKSLENVLMVTQAPFLEEISVITNGLNKAMTTQFLDDIK